MNIIDNRASKLVDAVNDLLGDTTFSSMAVGYFYLSGFEAIRPHLGKVRNLRLLIGNSTNQRTADELIAGHARLDIASQNVEQLELLNRDQVRAIVTETADAAAAQLERTLQDDTTERGIRTLAELIAENRVEIRVFTRGTLHSKAYLFEYEPGSPLHKRYKGVAIVGSSNLSYGGLSANTELNVVLKEQDDFDKVEFWFNTLWEESEPFDAALLSIVQKSWVHHQISPYELYLKVLYELVKDRLQDDDTVSLLDEMNLPPLMDFQKAAFTRACGILERNGGVFVSDVVGFGKSYIGSAVIKYLRDRKRERTLIICPAKLVPMWETYNHQFDLGARVLSMGMLKYPEEALRRAFKADVIQYSLNDEEDYEQYKCVLIDESHNFRNPNTDRYQILAPYLHGRKVVLLTATPQNKSVWDYYYQIKLFHPQERTTLPIPTARLDTFFAECEKRPTLVSQLLDQVLIRRRRRDIVDIYKPVLNGQPVIFPTRSLQTWTYAIENTYQRGLYDDIVHAIRDELKFTRYGLSAYLRKNLPAATRKKYDVLAKTGTQLRGLIKILLLKRMESSAQAFVNTITNMLNGYRVFRAALDSGVVLVGRKMDAIVRQMLGDRKFADDVRDAIDDESLVDLYEVLADEYRYDIADFRHEALSDDTDADIATLERLLNLVKPVLDRGVDDKRDELVRQLKKLDGQKVLIFTEFQDTAIYLQRELTLAFPERTIGCATGSNSTVELVRRFAPKANTTSGHLREGEPELDLLIATDALSEGQNLQDAGIVVNYDIHWNPVRLIQRIGRVDRIGSEASVIRVFNFLPERALEAQLNLQARVQRRVQEIHDVLGEDDKILTDDETLNEKTMYAIADGDEAVLDDDVLGEKLTPLQQAERVIRDLERNQPDLLARIKALPGGVRGALPESAGPGKTFAFFRAGNYRKLYLHQSDGAITSDEGAVLDALRCALDAAGLPRPQDHNTRVMKLFNDFETEVRVIESERANQRRLARGQEYVDRVLREHFGQLTDPRERRIVEDLRQVFTGDLAGFVLSALGRLQREKVAGKALVQALSALYTAFDLGAEAAVQARQAAPDNQSKIVCSGTSE